MTSGCARILRGQSRLSRLAARESLTARNLRECEEFCQTSQRFTCRSFSFSSTAGYTSNNYPNCQLSELDEINLTDRDLEPDYSGDVYILSSSCGGSSSSSTSSYISKYPCNTMCANISILRMFQLCQARLQDILRVDADSEVGEVSCGV